MRNRAMVKIMTDTCYGCKHLKMRDSPNYKWAGFLCEKNLPKKGELLGEVGGIDLVCKHPMRQAEDCFVYMVE
jgi:hypothetical protein